MLPGGCLVLGVPDLGMGKGVPGLGGAWSRGCLVETLRDGYCYRLLKCILVATLHFLQLLVMIPLSSLKFELFVFCVSWTFRAILPLILARYQDVVDSVLILPVVSAAKFLESQTCVFLPVPEGVAYNLLLCEG